MLDNHLQTLILLAKIAVADQVSRHSDRRHPDFPGYEEAQSAIRAAEAQLAKHTKQ